MLEEDYRLFARELAFLESLPGVEVHMHPYFIELPLLATLFELLRGWPDFGKYQWLIFSRQHEAEAIRCDFAKPTVLFYMANEDGTLPAFYRQMHAVFTPDLAQSPPPPRVWQFPLGCNGDLPEVPYVPYSERKLDVFFSGQVIPQRTAFITKAIQLLFDLAPYVDLMAQIQFTPRFRNGLSPEDYARTLMDSRIALIPPGYSPITLRLFEAMRSGCVIFTPKLPPLWYISKLPHVQVKEDWSDLSYKVLGLLNDRPTQLKVHAATRRHYQSHCTPPAIADYVIRQLLSVF